MSRQGPLMPLTSCRECGRTHRSYTQGALCGVCLGAVRADRVNPKPKPAGRRWSQGELPEGF